MKVILYMAISVDGYIAKRDDNTDWVCNMDWRVFSRMLRDAGCIVMGRRTYEVSGEDFPYDCDLNIVMTSDSSLHGKLSKKVIFTDKNPRGIVDLAKGRGFDSLLVIGGGKTNAAFLEEGLIDEIFLSLHPKVLGDGIKLFDGGDIDVDLERLGVKQLEEGLVQLHYRVKK
jgi:dihydrofolate reductase